MDKDVALVNFLNAYNECWYNKDLEKLKEFYDYENDVLIYFDNHSNNDTYTVEGHMSLISDFFKNGKSTESGDIEPLIIENMNTFHKDNTACLCYIAKYQSCPVPAVRSTLYLEWIDKEWKIIHAHYSFQP